MHLRFAETGPSPPHRSTASCGRWTMCGRFGPQDTPANRQPGRKGRILGRLRGRTYTRMDALASFQVLSVYGISRARICDMFLCSFCSDSSSPQISAILVGHFTLDNGSTVSANLSNAPQNYHNNCADKYQHPGSQNSLLSVFA